MSNRTLSVGLGQTVSKANQMEHQIPQSQSSQMNQMFVHTDIASFWTDVEFLYNVRHTTLTFLITYVIFTMKIYWSKKETLHCKKKQNLSWSYRQTSKK